MIHITILDVWFSTLIVHHKPKPDFRHLSSDGDSLEINGHNSSWCPGRASLPVAQLIFYGHDIIAEKKETWTGYCSGRSLLFESILLESLARDNLLKSVDEAKFCSISTCSLLRSLLFAIDTQTLAALAEFSSLILHKVPTTQAPAVHLEEIEPKLLHLSEWVMRRHPEVLKTQHAVLGMNATKKQKLSIPSNTNTSYAIRECREFKSHDNAL